MKNFAFCIMFLLGIQPLFSSAQSAGPDSASLQGQYQSMLQKSRTMDGYKVINPNRLSLLWRNASDSIRTERKKVVQLKAQLDAQTKTIAEQKSSLTTKEQSLAESRSQVDEVNVLGFAVNKSTYNLVMWGLVIILALALTIILLSSARYRREARYRIKLFEELSQEFQAHKAKANEKEKKLARELQDERNKLDDLLKR